MKSFKTVFTAFSGLFSIETLHALNVPELLKFGGETVIGILTIWYLILKIQILNKIKKQ